MVPAAPGTLIREPGRVVSTADVSDGTTGALSRRAWDPHLSARDATRGALGTRFHAPLGRGACLTPFSLSDTRHAARLQPPAVPPLALHSAIRPYGHVPPRRSTER